MFCTKYCSGDKQIYRQYLIITEFFFTFLERCRKLCTLHVVADLDILWYCFLLPSYAMFVTLLCFLISDLFQVDPLPVFIVINMGFVGFIIFVTEILVNILGVFGIGCWVIFLFWQYLELAYDHNPLMLMDAISWPSYTVLYCPLQCFVLFGFSLKVKSIMYFLKFR